VNHNGRACCNRRTMLRGTDSEARRDNCAVGANKSDSLAVNGIRGNRPPDGFRLRVTRFQRSWFRGHAALFVAGWLEAGRLFENIQSAVAQYTRIALRIAYPIHPFGSEAMP
jgi:hypothetical protein